MSRRRYTSEAGQFACKYCGTIYPWSDLRDNCEGAPWFLDEPSPHIIWDPLDAQVGEMVLRTQYYGDDFSQAPWRPGILLTWQWETVREKRVIPLQFDRLRDGGKSYHHEACYRIGEKESEQVIELVGEHWNIPAVGGGAVAMAIGPYHFWSQRAVERLGRKWPDYVFGLCRGEQTRELLLTELANGCPIFVGDVTDEEARRHKLIKQRVTAGTYERWMPEAFRGQSVAW